MSTRYPKLPIAVLLGSIGWLLLLHPQFLNLYALVVSGQRVLYRSLAGGLITSSENFSLAMLGIVIGPLAAALALLAMFSEVSGHRDARARRAASCLAAVLLLTSAAAVIWLESLMNQGIPPAGLSVAEAVLSSVFLCSWALLFGIFAGTTSPFRSRFTRAIAGLVAMEAAFLVVQELYFLWGHWRDSHVLANIMTVSPYALMLVFLLVATREGATPANTA